MKIGIFGGAFNPIHNGHLMLADHYFSNLELDKLLLIPTAVPPHKSAEGLACDAHRLNMAKLAVQDKPEFEVSDIEFKRSGKSYTYDTLSELSRIYPSSELYLIIGADQFLNFHRWYRYRDILGMATLCTSARENEGEKALLLDYAVNNREFNGRYYIADYPVMKLSSSEIRDILKRGGDASSFLPESVYNYIVEKGLYSV